MYSLNRVIILLAFILLLVSCTNPLNQKIIYSNQNHEINSDLIVDIDNNIKNLVVFENNNKFGILNNTNIVDPIYDKIYSFSEGLALAETNHQYSLICKISVYTLVFSYKR